MSMRRHAGTLPVLVLATLVLAAARGGAAEPARFTVTDELAADEVSENTDIYVDGKLLAHIHLDANRPTAAITGHAADPDGTHSYALCGDITVRRPDGRTETHEVDASGMLADVDGRQFQALGAADFTFFYLADPAPGRVPTAPSRNRSPLCHPPES